MAAYAALVSLMHIIDQLQHHPRPPISLDKAQVESLTERVTFLQSFLETTSYGGMDTRIAAAAHAAEDLIESHVVDQIQILAGRSTSHGKEIRSIDLYQGLQKVMEDMDFIKKEAMKIEEENMGVKDDELFRNSMITNLAGSTSKGSPQVGQNITVGLDDVLIDIMDKLTSDQSARQIIPIVGMGGIGKTTLARTVYENPLIMQRFDILAWSTISQDYNIKNIIFEVLSGRTEGMGGNWSQMDEHDLGDKLHKKLSGRSYLIILDDLWSIEVWEKIKFFFPDNANNSRIVITTRLSNLASQLTQSDLGLEMSFLDDDTGWNLLCKIVFQREDCPIHDLKRIGKKIVKNCKGLPLSISVIGGLLAKSPRTQKYWGYIATNLSSIVNLEDEKRCLKILRTSYDELPIHLKPCFLYMGVFREDRRIRASSLRKLWVAERFLKSISGKSMEEVAEEYLKDLTDRNLVLVRERGRRGKIQYFNMHDLLRDLSLREAEKEKFLHLEKQTPHRRLDICTQRRICFHHTTSERVSPSPGFDPLRLRKHGPLPFSSLARSLIWEHYEILQSLKFRLLRVLKTDYNHPMYRKRYSIEDILHLVNLRYLALRVAVQNSRIPPSLHHFWNLQTLIAKDVSNPTTAPSEIWEMPQLRHVEFPDGLYLPDPPSFSDKDGGDNFVLRNLQTLRTIINFKCGEEVIKRIPNIKKLRIKYKGLEGESDYCLNNLSRLHQLESLNCEIHTKNWVATIMSEISLEYPENVMWNLTFPNSLKKLTLLGTLLNCDYVTEMVGSLPLLQVLILGVAGIRGSEWETAEEKFGSLTHLEIHSWVDLKAWTMEATHFPRLKHLTLRTPTLEEIPSAIGDIPTIRSLLLMDCMDSAVHSAKQIQVEQEDFGNEDFYVRVKCLDGTRLKHLVTSNFRITDARKRM